MDLENIWRQDDKSDDTLKRLLDKGDFGKITSQLPLSKLRSNLLIGIGFAAIISCGYIAIFFFISLWQVIAALCVLVGFNVTVMVESWKLYRKTPATITASNSLKQELTLHYNSFQRWWALQQKMSVFVYPIAVAGGFILGGYLGSGKPVEDFLYNSKMLGILIATNLVMVPLCYVGAKWMFNYAYGKHLKKIKATIGELS